MKVEKKEKDIKLKEKNVEKSNQKNDRAEKKRDIAIDFIRIVACLIVIATHLALTTYNIYEVQVDWSRLFTKCFLADGVGLFFLITGFFISNGRDYKKVWKNTAKKIILPSFIVLVFCEIFRKFLVNQETFWNCIINFRMDGVINILSSIIRGEVHQTIPVAAHLWYIYAYIQIMIVLPLLQLVCTNEKQATLARRILIGLSILNILATDMQKFGTLPIGRIEIFSILDPKLLMVLLGYEMYCLKDKIKNNKKCLIFGILIFGIINILRYKAEMQYMIINKIVKEAAFISWDSIFGIISTISLFAALYSLDIKNKILNKIIPYLSSMTFGIYLVHFLIIAKIDIFKFEKISTVKYELLYMFLGTLTIFILSFILVFIIKNIVKYIKDGVSKFKIITSKNK